MVGSPEASAAGDRRLSLSCRFRSAALKGWKGRSASLMTSAPGTVTSRCGLLSTRGILPIFFLVAMLFRRSSTSVSDEGVPGASTGAAAQQLVWKGARTTGHRGEYSCASSAPRSEAQELCRHPGAIFVLV